MRHPTSAEHFHLMIRANNSDAGRRVSTLFAMSYVAIGWARWEQNAYRYKTAVAAAVDWWHHHPARNYSTCSYW